MISFHHCYLGTQFSGILTQNELVNITMKAIKEDGASKNNLKFLLTNTTENTLPNSRNVW